MTTYELETGTIGFLELPNGATNISLDKMPNNKSAVCFHHGGWDWIEIPIGFKPLSIFSQLKEEDVKEVMPKSEVENEKFRSFKEHFTNPYFFWCETAIESIHSLAKHLGLNAVNEHGEKPTFSYEFPEDGPSDSVLESAIDDFDFKSIQWQQAQSKVKQYFVVFKAKAKE